VIREFVALLTSNKHLSSGTLLHKRRGISVDGTELVGEDGTTFVDGLANNVDNSAESLGADGHHNGGTGVRNGLATNETLGGVHSNGTHVVSTQMLGNLKDEDLFGVMDAQGIKNWGKGALELNVDDGTNNLGNLSFSRGKAAYRRFESESAARDV
jgi:hypothetical protein